MLVTDSSVMHLFIFALGCIVVIASTVEIVPNSIYPCRTSQNCTRYLRCKASGKIKWSYPNSTVITTTDSTARIFVEANILTINTPMESDAGNYTCYLVSDNTKRASVLLKVIVDPYFIYGNSPLYESKTVLRYHDVFLNCSVNPPDRKISWEFNHSRLDIRDMNKYAKNNTGLTIYNVTDDDQGVYVCLVGNVSPLEAFISLNIIGSPPQLLSPQNEELIVNVSRQVVLNCSASALPDPVYTWIIPDCLSCPKSNHSSTLNFIVDIDNSGKYICAVENEYGNVSKMFFIDIHSKPIMQTENQKKIIKNPENIMLTCGIRYAYPVPRIEWNITTSSGLSVMKQNFNYRYHSNGSIEIFHRFLSEVGHIITSCSATNMHGTGKTIFHLWEHEMFTKKQQLTLYIKNITDCYQLLKDTNGLLAELLDSLHQWFNSTCYCDGYNNLYNTHLTCVDDHNGNITSTIRLYNLSSALELIELTKADIQMRDPPVVQLPYGWILSLNGTVDSKFDNNSKNDNGSREYLPVLIVVGVTSFCTILSLIFCIAVALLYIKHERKAEKATNSVTNKVNAKEKSNNYKITKEDQPHIYDEVFKQDPLKCSKNIKDDVVFDTSPPPGYKMIAASTCDDGKCSNRSTNDYYVDMGFSKDSSNAEEKHKDLQSN